MATIRDFDQMLQAALELKATAQKFIDFAKLQGAGEGDEGEEDLEEAAPTEEEGAEEEEETPGPMNKPGKNAAIIIALKKKFGSK